MKLVGSMVTIALVGWMGCTGDSAAPGGGDDGGARGPDASVDPGGDPGQVEGCDGADRFARPADPSRRGPWPVGARTVTVGRLTTEIWYPAARGSERGVDPAVYDIRLALPASQRDLIPDQDNPWQPCDCYRDLPLDGARGPYPVVVFIHGTAAFRTQSLHIMAHWASRGFVVVAADHPGLNLADTLSLLCPDSASGGRDLVGDADALLDALRAPAGALDFLAGHVAADRVGVVGHSAGGSAVASLADRDGVRVVMPFAAVSAVEPGDMLEQTLFVAGMSDAIASFDDVVAAYDGSPAPRRLVGIRSAGHLVVSDLCSLTNAAGDDMLEVAQAHGVCGAGLAGGLFDCDPDYLPAEVGWQIVDYASSAVLESALQCADRDDALAELQARFNDVGEYLHQP